MKTGKRIVSILLVALMLLTVAPLAGFVGLEIAPKAKALATSGECGDHVYWEFIPSSGELIVSGSGAMDDYTASYEDNPSPFSTNQIKSLLIGNGVTSIGNNAFSLCAQLKNLEIPNSVVSIGEFAFSYCTGLETVTIGNGVTNIGDFAFSGCYCVTSFSVSAANTNYASDENGCLYNKDKTTLTYYPCGNTRSTFPIPNSVKHIGDCAFEYSNLTSVTIPGNVTSIGSSSFQECSLLKSVTIPDSVISIEESAFSDCSSLLDVTIGNGVTSIGADAFNGCSLLKNVIIPDSVKSLGSYAFSKCSSLESVKLSNGLTMINDCTFEKCVSLKSVMIPDSVTRLYWAAFVDCGSLESVTIGNSVTRIDQSSFGSCTSLKQVTIPESVITIGLAAFSDCSALESVTFQGTNTHVSHFAFENCVGLKDVYFNGTRYQWMGTYIGLENEYLENAKIHCTDGTINGDSEEEIVESIKLDRESLIMSVLSCRNLVATVTPEEASDIDIVWTSSDPTVATVNKNGEVMSKREGITFVTAEIEDYDLKATCKVIVRGYDSGVFSLGEETYGFTNFSDEPFENDSYCKQNGHCHAMAVTSSMFYLGLLDKAMLGEENKPTYEYNLTEAVHRVLCDYQVLQGSYCAKAIVAGGYAWRLKEEGIWPMLDPDIYLHPLENDIIEREWNQVVRYVKKHNYDNKGNLFIPLSAQVKGVGEISHTISFLRYENVGGEDRIYTYDSRYPNIETYFYREKDGSIQQAPYREYLSIYPFALCDTNEYFNATKEHKKNHTIYAQKDSIVVERAKSSDMSGSIETGLRQVMYELPDDLSQVRIVPLVGDAEFTYMNQTYHIHREDENTIGILKLAESEDDTGTLTIINDPDNHVHIYTAELTADPTCTEKGEVTCTCTRCSNIYIETIDALGHYDNNDDNICDNCGEPMPDEEHTHTYTLSVTTEPTCTADGETTYTCSICGDTYTEPIPATGEHEDADNDGYCDTCEEMMQGGQHCKYCGQVHSGPFGWLIKFFHSILAIFKR